MHADMRGTADFDLTPINATSDVPKTRQDRGQYQFQATFKRHKSGRQVHMVPQIDISKAFPIIVGRSNGTLGQHVIIPASIKPSHGRAFSIAVPLGDGVLWQRIRKEYSRLHR